MGYRSDGYGKFVLRNGKNLDEALEMLEEEGFEYKHFEEQEPEKGKHDIRFCDWKMYFAGKTMKRLMKFFNGKFTIEGEEPTDIWELEFKDGKAFERKSHVVFEEPVETDLESGEWN